MKHRKKLMYAGLLLIFAALYFLRPNLSDVVYVVGTKDNADIEIRDGGFMATRPLPAERGDFIYLERPNAAHSFTLRLIGLPGDVVRVGDGGIFVNEKPIDTTFLKEGTPIHPVYGNHEFIHELLEKGTPIPPVYGTYTVPPDEIVIGTGGNEPGAFQLITIDKHGAQIRRAELVFSTTEMNRSAFLAVLVGFGYVFLLIFGPLLIERKLDPQEQWYRPLKFLWYGLWIFLFLVAGLTASSWGDLTFWQKVEAVFIIFNQTFTSLLVYLGASIKGSEIAALVTGVSGLAAAVLWLWQHGPGKVKP